MTPPADDTPGSQSELIQRYQAELRAEPGSLVFVPLARELAAAGRHQEAVDVCRRGLAKSPEASDGRLVLARSCLALKRPADAIVELTRLLKSAPDSRDPLCLLAEALLERGDASRAQQVLQRAAQVSPDDAEIATLLATARARLAASPLSSPLAASPPRPPVPRAAPAAPAAPEVGSPPDAPGSTPPARAAAAGLPLPTKPAGAGFAKPWSPPVAAPARAAIEPAPLEAGGALDDDDAPTPIRPARPMVSQVLAPSPPVAAPVASPPGGSPPAAAPRPVAPSFALRGGSGAADFEPTPTGHDAGAPYPIDGTLASTVLRADAPLVAPDRATDEHEAAWHRARRTAMRLVWATALGLALLATGVTLVVAMMRRADVERRFHAAAANLALGSPQAYRAAAADYREILRREPDNTRAASRLALSVTLLAAGYGEGADSATQAQVQRAWFGESMRLRRKPGAPSPEILTARAVAALLQGERTEAERLVQQANAGDSRSGDVLHAAGLVRWYLGDLEGARSALKASLLTAADHVAPRLALAAIDLDDGATTDAAATYAEILKAHPDHGGALLGQALVAVEEGRGAAALDDVKGRLARAAAPPAGAAAAAAPTGDRLAPVGLEAWRQLALGQCLQQRGAAADAQAALEAATSGAPSDPRFQLRLLRARLAQGRLREAQAAFTAASRLLHPGHPALLLARAELALGQGFDAEAERLLEATKRSPRRDFALGRARLALGKHAPAAESFQAAATSRAADPALKVYQLVARQLVTGGQPAAPVVAALKQLASGAGAGLAQWALGRIFLAAGDAAQARPWLAAAQGDHHESGRAAVALATVLREQREPGAALDVLEKSLERGGELVPARAALGRLHELLFRNHEARVALARALGLEGTPPRGPRGYIPHFDDYLALALADARLGFLPEAEAALQQAVAAQATGPRLTRAQALVGALKGEGEAGRKALAKVAAPDVPLRVDLGFVCRATGDARAAEAAFTAALREDPDHVESLLGLGQLYLVVKDRSAQAIATFIRALAAWEKRPYLGKAKRAAIQVGLGRAYLLSGPQRAPERARAALDAAVVDAPGDADAHLHLGRYYFGEGDLAKSAASAVRALGLDPGMHEAHFLLGEATATSDPRRARAAFEEYLRLAKDGPHASAARQALERLK